MVAKSVTKAGATKKVSSTAKAVPAKKATLVKKASTGADAVDNCASIEHCKSWQVFRKKSAIVEALLKEAGFKISVNGERPRKGSFVVTLNGGGKTSKIVELLDMPRPFKKLREADIESDISKGIAKFLK